MKPFEYFDKRVKELLHDVNTYTLTEHREAVPDIVALTAELNDTDYRYAFEAYLKGRASCMADTVKNWTVMRLVWNARKKFYASCVTNGYRKHVPTSTKS